MFLDAVISSMEKNMVHFTLWNYNPINDNLFGDHWNGEDFSIFSPSTSGMASTLAKVFDSLKAVSDYTVPMARSSISDYSNPHSRSNSAPIDDNILHSKLNRKSVSPSSATPKEQFEINEKFFESELDTVNHVGGRALDAIVRPYAPKISGIPISMRYDYKKRDFFLCFASHPGNKMDSLANLKRITTEIFVPNYQYGDGCVRISVSDGIWRYDQEKETLYWQYDLSYRNYQRMQEKFIDDDDDLYELLYISLMPLILFLSLFFNWPSPYARSNECDRLDINYHWIHIRPS